MENCLVSLLLASVSTRRHGRRALAGDLPTDGGLVNGESAVDVEDVARNEGRFVRCDEDDPVGNLLCEAETIHRNATHKCRLVLRRARKPGQHVSVRSTRSHGVYAETRP